MSVLVGWTGDVCLCNNIFQNLKHQLLGNKDSSSQVRHTLMHESEQILFQRQLDQLLMCFCFTETFLSPVMVTGEEKKSCTNEEFKFGYERVSSSSGYCSIAARFFVCALS